MPGLPAGVKFDPTDQELLEHLEGKVHSDARKLHPLIDEFIPTIEGENGICYTHPEKLPGDQFFKDLYISTQFSKKKKIILQDLYTSLCFAVLKILFGEASNQKF